MTTVVAENPVEMETMSDLLERLGDIPPNRVLMKPAPGTATVQDVIDLHDRTGRLCELVDGTLVEKGMGIRESLLAGAILAAIRAFVVPRNLGIVTGPDGMVRLFPGRGRLPPSGFPRKQHARREPRTPFCASDAFALRRAMSCATCATCEG